MNITKGAYKLKMNNTKGAYKLKYYLIISPIFRPSAHLETNMYVSTFHSVTHLVVEKLLVH